MSELPENWERIDDPRGGNKGEIQLVLNPENTPPTAIIDVEYIGHHYWVTVGHASTPAGMSELIGTKAEKAFNNRKDAIEFAYNQVEELTE